MPELPNMPSGKQENPRPLNFVPRYCRTPEAAAYLGLSPRALEKHRCYGTGPVYHKLGGRVVYAIEDIEAWASLGLRCSTSDQGSGTAYPAKRFEAVQHAPMPHAGHR
jgi:hypothetical protein